MGGKAKTKEKSMLIRLSESDKKALKHFAVRAGMNLSDYIRTVGLSKDNVLFLEGGQQIASELCELHILIQEAISQDRIHTINDEKLIFGLEKISAQFATIMSIINNYLWNNNDEGENCQCLY